MIFRFLGFLYIVLFTFTTWAEITLVGFDNDTFSRGEGRLFGDNVVNTNTIYGGYSGACRTANANSVCNSCEGINNRRDRDKNKACNPRRIHNNLRFTFSFTTSEAGPVLITTDTDDDQVELDDVLSSGGDVQAGSTVTVSILWDQICESVFGSNNGCEDDGEETLDRSIRSIRFGIDSDRDNKFLSTKPEEYSTEVRLAVSSLKPIEDEEGNEQDATEQRVCQEDSLHEQPTSVCNFKVYPGDGKVFVENIRAGCQFPSIGESKVQAIRVFYQEDFKGNPKITTPTFVDLPLSQGSSECVSETRVVNTTDNEVSGLTNGQRYYFAVGVVDKANNVGFVTKFNNRCFSIDDRNDCHEAIPEEVLGLINKDFDCFITTATYGTSFHPKVKVFREFRDRFLRTNGPGRFIIENYERYSPSVALWILQHPKSRGLVRTLLWPLWFFAKMTLKWPFGVLGLCLGLFVFVWIRWMKRFRGFLWNKPDGGKA